MPAHDDTKLQKLVQVWDRCPGKNQVWERGPKLQ